MTIISYYIFFPIKAVLGTTDKCHVNNMMTMTMMMLLLWRWLSKVGQQTPAAVINVIRIRIDLSRLVFELIDVKCGQITTILAYVTLKDEWFFLISRKLISMAFLVLNVHLTLITIPHYSFVIKQSRHNIKNSK